MLSPARRRASSWALLLDNSTDQGVVFGIGLTDIYAGEHERRHNDEQADRNADGCHARPQPHAEKFWRIGDQQDEAEVDDQHNQRQRPPKGRSAPHQLLIVGVSLDRYVASRFHLGSPTKSFGADPTHY